MKTMAKIEMGSLIKMIQSEKRAQYSRYRLEIDSPLSRICDSADALGPLVFVEKLGFSKWKLRGESYYSRFRPGDFVEIRVQRRNADSSMKFSEGWKVDSITYPAPGKIELVISSDKPLDDDETGGREVFLFKASSSLFNNLLLKKIQDLSKSDTPVILGQGHYDLSIDSQKFRRLYEELNEAQKIAIHYLIGNNLSGAIQGPPGTGKTQLLQAVVALALNSKMKVCVTSFTNTAVDNLFGRIVKANPHYEWVRIASSEKVRKDFYHHDLNYSEISLPNFKKDLSEYQLIGATLHKLAYNSAAPKIDLLVIDEAGQVPIYFWPFIQRLARRIVLVGDQFQLPPVMEATHKNVPFDNIFSLFVSYDTPMLETQYRMRREIQAWSSEKFYKGKLKPHSSVANRDYFSHSRAFLTDGFVVPKKFSSNSHGKCSLKEADFITDKIEKLIKARESVGTVGVICPYRAQAGIVSAALQNRFGVEVASKILVDTPERFQGQEREAIFLSLGCSGAKSEDLKFLSDAKRLNVAITRAKSRFFCLFDEQLFLGSRNSQCEDLGEFLQWVTDGRTSIKRAA